MCGFVAIYSPSGITESSSDLKKMLDTISHRGLDGSRIHFSQDGNFAAGFVRLSTNEFSETEQPFELSGNSLVFNGDIYDEYNHSVSDVEFLAELLSKPQIPNLSTLNGEFSFVIYKSGQKELYVCRDAFGRRPLYYWNIGDKFIFASEIRAILKHPNVSNDLNYSHVYHQLLRSDSTKNTLYRDINIFPIDTLASFGPNKSEFEPLNSIPWDATFIEPCSEIYNEVRTRIAKGVERRLSKRYPPALFLSGGLDSSIIAYEASKLSDNLSSFSIKFEGAEFDESSYARKVAQELHLDHHECYVSDKDLIEYFPEANLRCEHLVQQLDGTGKYLLAKEAGRNHRIALTGEGADELFLGYPSFVLANSLKNDCFLEVESELAKSETARLGGDLVLSNHSEWKKHSEKYGFYSMNFGAIREMIDITNMVLADDFNAVKEEYFQFSDLLTGLDHSLLQRLSTVRQNQYEFVKKTFHSYLMQYLGGKQEMSFGISGRLPFLDRDLVNAIFRIDPNILLQNGVEKGLLRKSYSGILSTEIVYRKKHGFSSSVLDPLLKHRPHYFVEAMSSKFLDESEFFSYKKVQNFLRLIERLPIGDQRRNLMERVIIFIVSFYILKTQRSW